MGFCFVFVSCLTWEMDDGTPRTTRICLFNCVDVCYFGGSAKVMALSPKAWIHLSSGHVWNCCQASISLERARKNSVC